MISARDVSDPLNSSIIGSVSISNLKHMVLSPSSNLLYTISSSRFFVLNSTNLAILANFSTGGAYSSTLILRPSDFSVHKGSSSLLRVALTIDEQYALLLTSDELLIYSIGSTESFTLVGQYTTRSGASRDVVASKDARFVYIADDWNGIEVVNVSNASSPSYVGTIQTIGVAYRMVVEEEEGQVYAATKESGVEVHCLPSFGQVITTGTTGTTSTGTSATTSPEASATLETFSSSLEPSLTQTDPLPSSSWSLFSGDFLSSHDPSTSQDVTDISSSSSSPFTVLIAAISGSVGACLVFLTAALIFFVRRKKSSHYSLRQSASTPLPRISTTVYAPLDTPNSDLQTPKPPPSPSSPSRSFLSSIPFAELTLKEEVGRGSFGVVFKGEHRGETVAIKFPKLMKYDEFITEASLMARVRDHPNVVDVRGVTLDSPGSFGMVIEWMGDGTLSDFVAKRLGMNPPDPLKKIELVHFARGIAEGMKFIHSKGIVHRDLACRNILVTLFALSFFFSPFCVELVLTSECAPAVQRRHGKMGSKNH
jgi:hypothetical protein